MRLFPAFAISFFVLAPVAPSQTVKELAVIRITRSGSQPPQPAPAENFTGSVRIDSPFQANTPAGLNGARVTFEPGARTAWHTHARGQLLIVTTGTGRVQRWGDPIEEIRQGDIVWIPPGQKHWHGAAPNTAMTHIGIVEAPDGKSTDWMEKVTDAQYVAPVATQAPSSVNPARTVTSGGEQPTAAQRLMGDIAPKLADLTDQVLFGDVWQRPQLSQRDRSLVTVAALIAMNRPDQLRSHFARARANGLTQEELVEAITHLAFYSGWPNAITAIGVAREVFKGN
jgi:4-carboxymuconolactone decarboxylase